MPLNECLAYFGKPLKNWCLMALAWIALLPMPGAAARLHLAAAADLAPCISELNAGFVSQHGPADIRSSIGSSGNFYAQIRNGAPFDVFLSADVFYPQQLAKAGLADPASLVIYAHGRLALWTVDPAVDVSAGLALLTMPDVTRIAIANPDVAPYGRAARAALQQAGIWEAVRHKLVYGENVAQTAQFVETGNAQVGLVGLAHVHAAARNTRGSSWPLPDAAQPVMEQGAIITARGRSNPLAHHYLAYLQSEGARAILRKYGFSVPGK